MNPLKRNSDKEVKDEGNQIITSLNKKLDAPSKGKELARKGGNLNEDDFNEDAIVDKRNDGGKLDKVVVARKDDGKERFQPAQKQKKDGHHNNNFKKVKKN